MYSFCFTCCSYFLVSGFVYYTTNYSLLFFILISFSIFISTPQSLRKRKSCKKISLSLEESHLFLFFVYFPIVLARLAVITRATGKENNDLENFIRVVKADLEKKQKQPTKLILIIRRRRRRRYILYYVILYM